MMIYMEYGDVDPNLVISNISSKRCFSLAESCPSLPHLCLRAIILHFQEVLSTFKIMATHSTLPYFTAVYTYLYIPLTKLWCYFLGTQLFSLMFVVHKNSPLPFQTFEWTSHPRKSDSPPVSELGSLPLTDIAMTPSTSSRPSRPRSAMAPSRRTASAGAAAASASASASARPQSAASSSQLRLQSQGAPGIWSRYEMIMYMYNVYI